MSASVGQWNSERNRCQVYFGNREPHVISAVLGIVYRVIAGDLIHPTGRTADTAQTGTVALIQRFGGALNLNVHFHMLFLDGVYCAA